MRDYNAWKGSRKKRIRINGNVQCVKATAKKNFEDVKSALLNDTTRSPTLVVGTALQNPIITPQTFLRPAVAYTTKKVVLESERVVTEQGEEPSPEVEVTGEESSRLKVLPSPVEVMGEELKVTGEMLRRQKVLGEEPRPVEDTEERLKVTEEEPRSVGVVGEEPSRLNVTGEELSRLRVMEWESNPVEYTREVSNRVEIMGQE